MLLEGQWAVPDAFARPGVAISSSVSQMAWARSTFGPRKPMRSRWVTVESPYFSLTIFISLGLSAAWMFKGA